MLPRFYLFHVTLDESVKTTVSPLFRASVGFNDSYHDSSEGCYYVVTHKPSFRTLIYLISLGDCEARNVSGFPGCHHVSVRYWARCMSLDEHDLHSNSVIYHNVVIPRNNDSFQTITRSSQEQFTDRYLWHDADDYSCSNVCCWFEKKYI